MFFILFWLFLFFIFANWIVQFVINWIQAISREADEIVLVFWPWYGVLWQLVLLTRVNKHFKNFPIVRRCFADTAYVENVLVLNCLRKNPNAKVIACVCFNRVVYFIVDADLLRKALGVDRELFVKEPKLYEMLQLKAPNLLTAEGDEWKKHRHALNPAFSEKNIELVAHVTESMCERIISQWSEKAKKKEIFDVKSTTKDLAFGVISEAGFGIRMPHLFLSKETISNRKQDPEIQDSLKFGSTIANLSLAVRHLSNKYPILSKLGFRIVKKTARAFSDFEEKVNANIDEAKLSNTLSAEEVLSRSELRKHNIVTLLTSGHTDLTDSEILSDGFILNVAGFDTSAVTMYFMLYALANNPSVQQRAFEEVKSIVGFERKPKYEDVGKFTYIRDVMKETLRMWPIVSSLPRIYVGEGSYEGYKFKQNDHVEPFILGLHRNPKYWKDANTFNPDRWVNTDSHEGTWIPFSFGPRSCIGQRFATVEILLFIASILQRFKLEAITKNLELTTMITVRSSHPILIFVAERNNQ